jgi:OOP family OmpA-OmpF porin
MQIAMVDNKNGNAKDTADKHLALKQASVPKNMITYFAFDKSDFISNTETDKYFDESNAYLDQNSKAMLSITGYTDAIGTEIYNQALGYRRAQSMQHYFERKGILSNKIIIESRGEKDPADDNNTSAGRANNRRTVITIKK